MNSQTLSKAKRMDPSVGDFQPSYSPGILPLPFRPKPLHTNAPNLKMSQAPADVTILDYNPEYMHHLLSFLQTKKVLEATGYVLQELSENDIERKKKCQLCGKAILKGKVTSKGEKDKQPSPSQHSVREAPPVLQKSRGEEAQRPPSLLSQASTTGSQAPRATKPTEGPQTKPPPKAIVRCKFHDGAVRYKTWSCCGNHVSSDPCKEAEFHTSRKYQKGQLENAWKFHETPSANVSSGVRPAVAIDCEMGTAVSGDSELIRVTVIDYFSSKALVDSLVYPDVAMQHYNTRYSGVTARQMNLARSQGRCFMGKRQAREAVWRFVGPNTVVVGHSAHNDLTAMRWIHQNVVDTLLIESIKSKDLLAKAKQEEKEPPVPLPTADDSKGIQPEKPKKVKGSGALSLKTLTRLRWGREIQMGNRGHDSLEDAIAARDLAHWNVLEKLGKI